MKEVNVYTDGACSGNPGKGGYCAILIYGDIEKIISGFEDNTTNNRMEILAAIMGLKALKEPCKVNLYSDSQYLISAFNEGWIFSWQQNNWKNSNKKEVKNIDLWKEIINLTNIHDVTFIKVKGHSDNEYNNRCDKIAVQQYLNN